MREVATQFWQPISGYTDPDDNDADVTFTTSSPVNGKIQVNGVDATTFTGTQLTLGEVTFVHDGSATTSASFLVNVEDGNEDSSTPTDSPFTFIVNPVSPVIDGTVTEDASAPAATETVSGTVTFPTGPTISSILSDAYSSGSVTEDGNFRAQHIDDNSHYAFNGTSWAISGGQLTNMGDSDVQLDEGAIARGVSVGSAQGSHINLSFDYTLAAAGESLSVFLIGTQGSTIPTFGNDRIGNFGHAAAGGSGRYQYLELEGLDDIESTMVSYELLNGAKLPQGGGSDPSGGAPVSYLGEVGSGAQYSYLAKLTGAGSGTYSTSIALDSLGITGVDDVSDFDFLQVIFARDAVAGSNVTIDNLNLFATDSVPGATFQSSTHTGGQLGAITSTAVTASGEVSWDYSVDNADIQFMAAGQTITETYSVTLDGQTKYVTILITGTNDAPVVSAVTNPADFTESDASSAQSVDLVTLFTASDVDDGETPAIDQSNISIAAATGSDITDTSLLSQNGTAIEFDTVSFNSLAAGESAIFDISFDVKSGTDTVSRTATIRINGENDAPVVSAVTNPADFTESDASSAQSVDLATLFTASDVDDGETPAIDQSSISIAAATGSDITDTSLLTQNGTAIEFDTVSFNSLAAGQSAIFDISFDVKSATDTVSRTATITINGENDAPVIDQTGPLMVTMSEDGSPTAFAVPTTTANDVDDSNTLSWSIASGADASHGTLSVSGTGASPTISYTPDSDYNGQDSFTIQVSDGTATDTIVVNVTVDPVAGDGTLTVGATAIDPTVGTPVDLALAFATNDATDSETVTVTISGIPVGATINFADPSLFAAAEGGNPVTDGDASGGGDLVLTLNVSPTQFDDPANPTDLGVSVTFNAPVANASLPVTWRTEDGTASRNGTVTITANAANAPSSGGESTASRGGSETTTTPIVVVSLASTGAQEVAEALAPEGLVDETAAFLGRIETLFNSFQTTTANFASGGLTGRVELEVERIQVLSAQTEGGQVNGLGFFVDTPEDGRLFFFAPLQPSETRLNFRAPDMTQISEEEAYHRLMYPHYRSMFDVADGFSRFRPLADFNDDEVSGSFYIFIEEQALAEAVPAAAEPESLPGLLDVLQTRAEPAIFAGLEAGAAGEKLKLRPVIAGVGRTGRRADGPAQGRSRHVRPRAVGCGQRRRSLDGEAGAR